MEAYIPQTEMGINFFASEKFALTSIGCQRIYQIVGSRIFNLKENANSISVQNIVTKKKFNT